MLEFERLKEESASFNELIIDLSVEALRELTDEMVSAIEQLIKDCDDDDVNFVPDDPSAEDPFASRQEDVDLAWTVGHVIAHITASAEESAALAAELARGVQFHGRSRYEVPWEDMDTIDKCHQRLAESRRMRLASLDMWPEEPHLENVYQAWEGGPKVTPIGRFVLGLKHDFDHIEQIAEIIRQSHQSKTHLKDLL